MLGFKNMQEKLRKHIFLNAPHYFFGTFIRAVLQYRQTIKSLKFDFMAKKLFFAKSWSTDILAD